MRGGNILVSWQLFTYNIRKSNQWWLTWTASHQEIVTTDNFRAVSSGFKNSSHSIKLKSQCHKVDIYRERGVSVSIYFRAFYFSDPTGKVNAHRHTHKDTPTPKHTRTHAHTHPHKKKKTNRCISSTHAYTHLQTKKNTQSLYFKINWRSKKWCKYML